MSLCTRNPFVLNILVPSLGLVLVSACSPTRPPRPVAAQDSIPISTEVERTGPTVEKPTVDTATKPKMLVLDSGQEESPTSQPKSLLEASRLAKERRKVATAPVAVITNQNLKDYAKRGNLTIGAPSPPPDEPQQPAQDASQKDEKYWRSKALELRTNWRVSSDAVAELEARAEALRQEFYSELDLYRRDTRLKPAWDRVLDRLAQAKHDAEKGKDDLLVFIEEGRRQGALPGWLREGIELEPEGDRVVDDDLPEAEATEPVVIDSNFR